MNKKSDSDILTEPHAVRWARSENRLVGMIYGKWHWTIDASLTLCGHIIPIGLSRGTFLPETDDYFETVTCTHCIRKHNAQKHSVTRDEWLREYANCKYKFVDGSKVDYATGHHGNVLCGETGLVFRCMYKKCPLIKVNHERD